MKVCTHAGLSNKEKRLLKPDRALVIPAPLLGDGLRLPGDEGGESGGAGRRVLERVLREFRPDSKAYGVSEERRRPAFLASSSFSSSSISTSLISSLTPCSRGMA